MNIERKAADRGRLFAGSVLVVLTLSGAFDLLIAHDKNAPNSFAAQGGLTGHVLYIQEYNLMSVDLPLFAPGAAA